MSKDLDLTPKLVGIGVTCLGLVCLAKGVYPNQAASKEHKPLFLAYVMSYGLDKKVADTLFSHIQKSFL